MAHGVVNCGGDDRNCVLLQGRGAQVVGPLVTGHLGINMHI